MKKIPVESAVGMELCHDITAMRDGFKGAAFKRGHIITEEDIPKLLDIGKKTIFVWEENAGEIHEEEAALRMAAMAPVDGAHYTEPSEGKVLLFADKRGMLRVDTELLREINSIGDITICTLRDHYPVEEGARLASMRIVPLVTKEEQILRSFFSQEDPAEILGVTICDDDLDMIVSEARHYLELGADFLIFTGGMSVDPDDLTPTAIRALGAEIVTHGVPSQPGNMTLIAYLGDVAIMGVPGAAISLPTTMFDVLVPQIFVGDKFTKEELVRLGDGGLCQMCKVCHFPNCTFGSY